MRITRRQLRQIVRESLNEIALDNVNQDQAQQRLNILKDILNDDEMLPSGMEKKYREEIDQICKEYPDLEGCPSK